MRLHKPSQDLQFEVHASCVLNADGMMQLVQRHQQLPTWDEGAAGCLYAGRADGTAAIQAITGRCGRPTCVLFILLLGK